MTFTFNIPYSVDLTQQEFDKLKELSEEGGIYLTSGDESDLLDKLTMKGLATEESSNLVTINHKGIALLNSFNA